MLPSSVYKIRVSDERQDTIRQVEGLRAYAEKIGDNIPAHLWKAVLDKKPLPESSPVQWDFGARDEDDTRPSFQRIYQRVLNQKRTDPDRLKQLYIWDFDRFGCIKIRKWFAYANTFVENGCGIFWVEKGVDLTADEEDIAGLITQLFEQFKSGQEPLTLAKRVSDQQRSLNKDGKDFGTVPYGLDRGCFAADGSLLWRLFFKEKHYSIQYFYDNKGNIIHEKHFPDKNSYPKKSDNESYRPLLSIDSKRVEAIKEIFRLYNELHPIGFPTLASMIQARFPRKEGWNNYLIEYILQNPKYIGLKRWGKHSRAKYKRGADGQKVAWQDRKKLKIMPDEDCIISEKPAHEAIIDMKTWEQVQEKLDNAVRQHHAPRKASYYLKPILYCGKCFRQMECATVSGREVYVCASYQMYRNRNKHLQPDEAAKAAERYNTGCGKHTIAQSTIEAFLISKYPEIEKNIKNAQKNLSYQVMEAELEDIKKDKVSITMSVIGYIEDLEAVFNPAPDSALFQSMRQLELIAKHHSNLTPEQRKKTKHHVTLGRAFIATEKLKEKEAKRQLDELNVQLTHFTKGHILGEGRQKEVCQAECKRIEGQMDVIERHAKAILDRIDEVRAREKIMLDRLERAKQASKDADLRARANAYAQLFSKVLVYFRLVPCKKLVRCVWLPEETKIVLKSAEEETANSLEVFSHFHQISSLYLLAKMAELAC